MKFIVTIIAPQQRNSLRHLTLIRSVSSHQLPRNELNPISQQEVSLNNHHTASIRQASNSMASKGSSNLRPKKLLTIAMAAIHSILKNLLKKLLRISPPKLPLKKPTSLTSTWIRSLPLQSIFQKWARLINFKNSSLRQLLNFLTSA